MTIYWDEKVLDVWNNIQIRSKLAEMKEQQVPLTLVECLDGCRVACSEFIIPIKDKTY